MQRRSFSILLMMSLAFSILITANCSAEDYIKWNSVEQENVVGYRIYYGTESGSYPSNVDVGNVTKYSLDNIPLESGVKYYFVLLAYGENAESPFSDPVEYICPDTTPPVAPNWKDVQVFDDGIKLSWDANAETDIGGYKIYYGVSQRSYSLPVSVGNLTEYTLTGLEINTPYYFALSAVDEAGNESGLSEEKDATIVFIDTSAPVITIVSPEIIGVLETSSSSIDVSGTSSDNVAVSSVSWQNSNGESGIATGTASWFVNGIMLDQGENIITFQTQDDAGNISEQTVVVNYSLPNDIPVIETGELIIDHNVQRVSFKKSFSDPIVIVSPLSYNGWDPSVVRISNVDSSGFDVQVQEWEYLDGNHDYKETVNYVAVERGSYTLADGTMLEAGRFETSSANSFEKISFNKVFNQAPVVVTSITTKNETDPVCGRIQGILNSQFEYQMQESELKYRSNESHGEESVAYIAWEPSLGTMNGMAFEVGKTTNKVTQDWAAIHYTQTFSETPVFIGDMQTFDGSDTSNIRYQNKTNTRLEVMIDEEQSRDEECTHTTEVVGYFVLSAMDGSEDDTTIVYVDTAAPSISIVSPEVNGTVEMSSSSIDVSGTSSDNVSVASVSWQHSNGDSGVATGTDNWTVSGISLDEGENTITFEAKDAAGNISMATMVVNYSLPYKIPVMEIGEVDIDHNIQRVSFKKSFSDPIVIVSPLSHNGVDPAVVRITNVDSSGFDVQVQEWEYLDGNHDYKETVNYVAVERGSYTLADGTMLEAGRFTTSSANSFEIVSFNKVFNQSPVVVTSISTKNETDPVCGRVKGIVSSQFEYQMQESESKYRSNESHDEETVAYIAWEPSLGTMDGMTFEIGKTTNKVTQDWSPIYYTQSFSDAPVFIGDMQTFDGSDPSNIRYQYKTNARVNVMIDEELSMDAEYAHTTEVVGYMLFLNK